MMLVTLNRYMRAVIGSASISFRELSDRLARLYLGALACARVNQGVPPFSSPPFGAAGILR